MSVSGDTKPQAVLFAIVNFLCKLFSKNTLVNSTVRLVFAVIPAI
jgi:hypothetical protein